MTSESPADIKKVPVTVPFKKKHQQPKSLKQRALEKELGKVGSYWTCILYLLKRGSLIYTMIFI
jgi:hypothetical protein